MSDSDEKTRVTTIVQKSLGDEPRPRGNDCLVVIYTKEPTLLGKRFVLEGSPFKIGRGAENHIVLEGDSVSRRHVHFEQRGAIWYAVDDNSTNGTYVNDDQITRDIALANGDRIKVGPTIFKYLSGADVEAQYHEEIYRMTIIDGLTQAHVKRYLLEALEKEIIRARRHSRELSFLMFDVDHFKKINDFHGHLAGDFVLKELARIVQGRIRRDEVFARYGGEEFAIILPETNLDGARSLAEGLREKIEQSRFVFQNELIRVTVSIGVSQLREEDRTSMDLIKFADERLLEAKRGGRNRVVG
ncbi:diguanylate cyclase [Pendulispora albinea]|uniref:diguanylate cyclase n=1 Tax=Pendulispora albinea TaxID=2741071 RepID=A0ABZ2M0E9_9BACT